MKNRKNDKTSKIQINGSILAILRKDYMEEEMHKILYFCRISNNEEGTGCFWKNITVEFSDSTDIKNNTKIVVKKGFLKCYKNKIGLPKDKIIIKEFTKLEE